MHTKEHDASSLYQFSFFCNNVMMKLHFFYCCSQEIDKIPYPDPEMQAPTTQSPISGQNVTIGKHVI